MTLVERISDAIAWAEGYFVSGSRPQRNNNPGDLTQDLTGQAVGWDGPFVVYATAADGWDALELQVQKMLDGSSAIYDPSMSILQIAESYAPGPQSVTWAANVAARLGVAVDTTLESLLSEVGAGTVVSIGGVLFFVLLAVYAVRKGF